jgi:DNA mismatch endonuclease (patch repair protein)
MPPSKPARRKQAPSFRNLEASSARASRVLAANKATNTKCEQLLRSELWKMRLRFRKNVTSLRGKPDIVFPRQRIVVFCDGDFWHGRNWRSRKRKLERGANASYWVAKIQANIKRDRRNRRHLKKLGWMVITLWETDILADPYQAALTVCRAVRTVKKKRQPPAEA